MWDDPYQSTGDPQNTHKLFIKPKLELLITC